MSVRDEEMSRISAGMDRAFGPIEDIPFPTDDDEPVELNQYREKKNAMTADELTKEIRKDRGAWATEENFSRIMAQQDPAECERIRLVAVDNKFITKLESRQKNFLVEKKRKNVSSKCAGKEIFFLLPSLGRPQGYGGNPRVPFGYAIFRSESGSECLFRLEKRQRKDGEVIVPVLVIERIPIITAAFVAPDGARQLEVQYPLPGGGWESQVADRVKVLNSRTLFETLGHSRFPGSSHNSKDLVRWFASYLDENHSEIPDRKTSTQGGWQENGGFLLGDKFIAKEGTEEIHFASIGEGESDVLRGLSVRRGTMEGWRKAISAVHGHWSLELGLYAALAAPLQKIIGAANPIFEFAGPTSRGKTTALRLGASIFGENADGSSHSLLETWNLTPTALEFIQGAMCDLPSFIDDTQLAANRDGKNIFLQSAIHQHSEGRGRVRGAKDGGIRSTTKFRSFMLTTSENKLSDILPGEGAGARIISSYGSPAAGMSAAEVHALTAGIAKNCGHAGELFIRWLVDNEDRWDELRETYFELQEKYTARLSQVKNKGVLGRQVKSLALLGLAARLAVDVLDLPWGTDERDPVEEFLGAEFSRDLGEASKPEEVLQLVASAISASPARLVGTFENEQAKGTYYGESFGRLRGDFLELHTKVVEQIITASGHNPRSILRQWATSGVLQRPDNEPGALRTKSRFEGGSCASVYVFPLERFPSSF